MVKIALLECDRLADELQNDFGTYPQMMQRLLTSLSPDIICETYQAIDGQLPTLDAADGFIILGSQYSVYEDLPWMQGLQEWVVNCAQTDKPLIGICFGHQLISAALGGQVEKSSQGWGVGVMSSRVGLNMPWMQPPLDEVSLIVSHQDQVLDLPANTQVVMSNGFCPFSALLIGTSVLTFQGHPEFLPEYSRCLMLRRQDRIGHERVEKGLASLEGALDSAIIGRWITQFIRLRIETDADQAL